MLRSKPEQTPAAPQSRKDSNERQGPPSTPHDASSAVSTARRRRRKQHAQLIHKPRKQSANRRRRQLIQVRRNHPERPLHALPASRTLPSYQRHQRRRQTPTPASTPRTPPAPQSPHSAGQSSPLSEPKRQRPHNRRNVIQHRNPIPRLPSPSTFAFATNGSVFKKSGYRSCVPCAQAGNYAHQHQHVSRRCAYTPSSVVNIAAHRRILDAASTPRSPAPSA